jgi:hypothetical protein
MGFLSSVLGAFGGGSGRAAHLTVVVERPACSYGSVQVNVTDRASYRERRDYEGPGIAYVSRFFGRRPDPDNRTIERIVLREQLRPGHPYRVQVRGQSVALGGAWIDGEIQFVAPTRSGTVRVTGTFYPTGNVSMSIVGGDVPLDLTRNAPRRRAPDPPVSRRRRRTRRSPSLQRYRKWGKMSPHRRR